MLSRPRRRAHVVVLYAASSGARPGPNVLFAIPRLDWGGDESWVQGGVRIHQTQVQLFPNSLKRGWWEGLPPTSLSMRSRQGPQDMVLTQSLWTEITGAQAGSAPTVMISKAAEETGRN